VRHWDIRIWLAIFGLAVAAGLVWQINSQRVDPPWEQPPAAYQFTNRWTYQHTALWKQHLTPIFADRPISVLEVGIYEAQTAIWSLDNLFPHPSTRWTAIDPLDRPGLRDRCYHNIKASGYGKQIKVIEGYSQDVLPTLAFGSYDLVYLDGCHAASCVWSDSSDAWRLLAVGGVLIFDDTHLAGVAKVVALFLKVYRKEIEVIHQKIGTGQGNADAQVIVRKLTPQAKDRKR